MEVADVLIIGAGFAGASTAWHLAKMGCRDVVVLEREDLPGMHSSGLNASMMRQFVEDEVIARCSNAGADFIVNPPSHWKRIVDQLGSLLLFKDSRLPAIQKTLNFASAIGLESELVRKKDAVLKVRFLAGADFDWAVWTPTDGVVDINELLWSYLKDAKEKGMELRLRQTVVGIKRYGAGNFEVTTEDQTFRARSLVNASGAWAAHVAGLAGVTDMKLTPLRRHLYSTAVMEDVDPKWPFVWDIDNQYYFRPESGGLLLGPCDEDEVPPGIPSASHLVREMLAEKLERFCPCLAGVTIAKEWAGLRTFAPDRRFIIGADPLLGNFYWAAALGGFGVTCSSEVGRMVAAAILRRGEEIPEEFRPARFS